MEPNVEMADSAIRDFTIHKEGSEIKSLTLFKTPNPEESVFCYERHVSSPSIIPSIFAPPFDALR